MYHTDHVAVDGCNSCHVPCVLQISYLYRWLEEHFLFYSISHFAAVVSSAWQYVHAEQCAVNLLLGRAMDRFISCVWIAKSAGM